MATKRKVSGPGRLGSTKAVKDSLKSKGNPNIQIVPAEDSITVRFIEEPEEWYGYYEHFVDGTYRPCTDDDCEGCASDNPEERRKSFRYLANAYVIDQQKVKAVKMPKSLVEQLVAYQEKKGTIMDRDYELSRTGSGQMDTKYMASPDSPTKMKMDRFKPLDLDEVLASLLDGGSSVEEEEKPKKKKGKGKSDKSPWEDDDDEPVKKKKSSAGSKSASKKPVKKTVAKRRVVKK